MNGERFGKTGPVGEQPALDGSNRNAETDPGRNPLCEETPDQVRGTAFAIEIAQYQPVHPGGRSDWTRNLLVELRRPPGYDCSVRNQANVPNQPLGYGDIDIAFNSEVDDGPGRIFVR